MSVIVTLQPTVATFVAVDSNGESPALVIYDSNSTVRITARPSMTGVTEAAEFAAVLADTAARWEAAYRRLLGEQGNPAGADDPPGERRDHRGQRGGGQ